MPVIRPESLGDLDLERHLADPALRQAYVTPMFDLIASRYDRFTRVFSFGMDQGWKAELVAAAKASIAPQGVVCDAASGTGDLAFALSAARPDLVIAATDVSLEMLALAGERRDRTGATRVSVSAGDLSALPFPSASLDAITAGYALRNTPDWRASLGEMARVVRPGGRLFTLDFFVPASPVWREMFLAWLWAAGRAVGWWWHREPMAYGYIAHSIRHFTTVEGFSTALSDAGFDVQAVQSRLGGAIAIHEAVKRSPLSSQNHG
ncbi:MAG TPA: ubiquinone/menaquinone biosynthesis methyltransferase [Gemmatimonadaceae bacterium]